jgi:protein SCO1/2
LKFFRILSWSILAAGFIAVLAVLFKMSQRREMVQQDNVPVAEYVAPFALVDQSSRTVTLADLKGKVWVADFFFTRCQGPCPILTQKMKMLTDEFSSDNIRFVSFSVDPDYDRPAVLKAYADKVEADPKRWIFLTGTRPQIADVMQKSFALGLEQKGGEAGAPDITHSTRFALVDQDGRIDGVFNATDLEGMRGLRDEIRRLKP